MVKGQNTSAALRISWLVCLCVTLPARATVWLVTTNPDMTFTPADLSIRQGDAITFENRGGVHNVHADNNRFHCAVNCSTNTSPSATLWHVVVQFNLAGEFGYYCDQHGDTTTGMRGIVRVTESLYADGFESPVLADVIQSDP